MFLLNKYSWLELISRGIIRSPRVEIERYLVRRPTAKEVADDARDWLAELFSNGNYDLESKKIFELHPDFIVDFVRYEILKDSGVIKLIFPRGTNDDSIRADYELVTAIFLFHRHNSILQGNSESLIQDIKDFFYSYCPREHKHYTAISFDGKSYRYDDPMSIKALTQKVCDTLNKTSFVFRNPKNHTLSSVIEFPAYKVSDPGCVRLELTIFEYEDYDKTTYSDYLNYLLTVERNDIATFSSTLKFWQDNIQLGRQHTPLEVHPEPDKVLLLFSLALGGDHLVFSRLKKLRGRVTVNRDLPLIGEVEENVLYDMLKNIHWLSMDARQQVEKIEYLPRRMLLNANINLLSRNIDTDVRNWHKPIIELSGDEIHEVQEKIPENIWKNFYDCDENKSRWYLRRLRDN